MVAIVMAIALVVLIYLARTPTPPTAFTRDQANLAPIELPIAPETVLHWQHADLFAQTPQEIINYNRLKPPLETLRTSAQADIDRALAAIRDRDFANATRHLQSSFAVGANLYNERLAFDELEAGLGIMGSSTQAMALIADRSNDPARAQALRAFDRARLDYFQSRIAPTLRIVRSVDPNIVGEHSGDIVVLATHSRERMWRIEAILALGRMRYFIGTGRSADQRAAARTLEDLTKDPDPTIRLAATTALNLTAEQHRQQ